jgi:RNA polymerase sigma-70 factor (ECF subfamily)
MSTTEKAEIELLLSGNEEEAFRRVFDQYYPSLCAIAMFYVDDPDEAEDIVQQLLIKLWEEKHIFRVYSSVKGYLRQSIRNHCLNYLSRRSTLKRKMQQMVTDEEVTQALDFLLDEEERAVFQSALDSLPGQGRKALELVYFSGKSYKGAASALDVSVNTIKSHLRNALRQLKDNELIRQYYREKIQP